ncbi:MAG: lipid-binding SYLF domain-containing protein [Sulfurospirillum sp.]
MKRLSIVVLLTSLFLASVLNAGYNQERRVLTSAKILKDAMMLPKTGITKKILHNAKAIAVFPNIMKAAFFIGGRVGKGVMSIKNEEGKWSEPIFVSIKGVSIGMQFGFKATDLIVIFKTDRSLDDLASGKITIGIDAGVVAVAKGVQSGVKTDEKLAANSVTYGKSSGAFVGISISGASLDVNDNDDFDYYDKLIYVNDILVHDKVKDKPESIKFKQVLNSL